MKKDNFFITTPIYYPSGQPHMGHAYSSILADVFARFSRNDNCKVFFLTGTDEHGLKIQKAAEKKSLTPVDYCNKLSEVFKDSVKDDRGTEPWLELDKTGKTKTTNVYFFMKNVIGFFFKKNVFFMIFLCFLFL